MSDLRRWARRRILSALAGSGLTALGLGTSVGVADAQLGVPGGTPSVPTVPVPTTVTPTGSPQGNQTAPSTSTPPPTSSSTTTAPPAPTVSGQQGQSPTTVTQPNRATTQPKPKAKPKAKPKSKAPAKAQPKTKQAKAKAKTKATGPNNVALPPQLVANQFGVLPSALAGATVSAEALRFYRIPMFLLPIYQAAAIQYGVPWQVLAAINEVETNYGNDLSVSTAGALGWMQFEPTTWLQYGVDAINAGFADPYNPEDAIFAAARYLRAAGAQTDLSAAIYGYNHSTDYVKSVLLRARLITTYPEEVIATLTGMTEGTPPVHGARVVDAPKPPAPTGTSPSTSPSPLPSAGAPPATAPSPLAVPAAPPRFAQLIAAPGTRVVAVQDGRVARVGRSATLGNYLVLRDVYGDEFTYAGLGSLSARYPAPAVHAPRAQAVLARPEAEPARNPKASSAANAQNQPPRTLSVSSSTRRHTAGAQAAPPAGQAPMPGKERLFARPDPTVAVAAEQGTSASAPHAVTRHGVRLLPLTRGAILTAGTVIGHLPNPHGAKTAYIRFSVKPAGDTRTVDPLPVLNNWNLLQAALHPHGTHANGGLLGATAGDVFLLSTSQLQQAVLSDPGISIYACGRQDIASGVINSRVLALLAFLSRSGLKPTVTSLRCGHSKLTTAGKPSANARGDGVDISAINGIPIARHQGSGTITDTTIRTMLTLQGQFQPHQINSLMSYAGTDNTLALADHWDHLQVTFSPESSAPAPATGRAAAASVPPPGSLDAGQWDQLMSTLAAIPSPTVATKPSSSAILDQQAAPGNQTLGTLPGSAASNAAPVP